MEQQQTPAERFYKSHKNHVLEYQQRNPEKMKEKSKKYYHSLKTDNPEKYRALLQKRREYYFKNVQKKSQKA